MLSIPSGFYIGSLQVKFYGILMATAMAVGVILACINAKKRKLTSNDILLLACYVLPLAVIGARIAYFALNRSSFGSFWEIFEIWKGGLAIYGGVVGGAIGIMMFCLIHKKNFLDVADIAVPSLILGQAIGRWGNFFNQEAYGYPITNPSLQWFPFGVYIDDCKMEICTCAGSGWHMATFFYEFLFNMIIFAVLMILLRRVKINEKGVVMASYLLMYGAVRIFVEGLRTDPLMLGNIRAAQLFSGLIIAFAVIYLITIYSIKYVKKKKLAGADPPPGENNKIEAEKIDLEQTRSENPNKKVRKKKSNDEKNEEK